MTSVSVAGVSRNPGTIGMGSPPSHQSPSSFIPLASLNTIGFGSNSGIAQSYNNTSQMHRNSIDNSPPKYTASDVRSSLQMPDRSAGVSQSATLVLRRLPATMSNEALMSMLLFAEDFLDAKFTLDPLEEPGYQSALARFRTAEAAHEARAKLHGKPNATSDATMIVELLSNGSNSSSGGGSGRKLSDSHSLKQISSASSAGSAQSGANRLSRYNSTFQSMDKTSPTRLDTVPDLDNSDSGAQKQPFYTPHSPNATFSDRAWNSGKSMINDDIADDETGELLKDPIAFAKSGQSTTYQRHAMNQQIPISRMANLKIDTTDNTDSSALLSNGFSYGHRPSQQLQSPSTLEFSQSAVLPMSPTGYTQLSPHLQRPHYPAANPADQNPPCNTLYVGNLPIDTSEDELKAIFSKQRGYKRLCFRTKHNGPMCFVEFEDVTFATKALNELYGQPLHNSVKGGIRLSFSKNPLGVRTGQSNNYGLQSPLTSPNGAAFGGIGVPPGFGAASGPPPGLSAPPGLNSQAIGAANGYASNNGFFSPTSPNGMLGHNQPFRNQGLVNGHNYRNGGTSLGSGMPEYHLGH